jgi:predicted nucleic acid-binding protein
MIVLDTNVLSELMGATPAAAVLNWISIRSAANLYTTSITQAEILNGVLALPVGRRRRNIEAAAGAMFEEEFSGRILAFDSTAARPYAELVNERYSRGLPISQFDAQIAAIARAAGASVATRNVSDFAHTGVRIINPWADA